jgi:hypothetical protein
MENEDEDPREPERSGPRPPGSKLTRWLWAAAQVAHVVTAGVQVILLVTIIHVPLP